MSHNAGILLSEESNVNQTATVTDNNKLTYDSEHNADRLAVRENIDIDPNIHFHRDAQPKNNSVYDQTFCAIKLTTFSSRQKQISNTLKARYMSSNKKLGSYLMN